MTRQALQMDKTANGKAEADEEGTSVRTIEYAEICKAIRRRMGEELQAFNEKEQLEALEKGRGLKNIKRKQYV